MNHPWASGLRTRFLMPTHLLKHFWAGAWHWRVVRFTSAGGWRRVKVAVEWQLWLPSLSYPRGNYINRRTNTHAAARIHRENSSDYSLRGWLGGFHPWVKQLPSHVYNFWQESDYVFGLRLSYTQCCTVSYLMFKAAVCVSAKLESTKWIKPHSSHCFGLIFLFEFTLTWQASWIRLLSF